jgi:hypothetical protein
MFWFHVVAAHLASTGPLARCAAYAPSACFSSSRVPNKAIPSEARKVIQSRTARAYFAQVPGAGAPLTGSSRSHRFAATPGRHARVLEDQIVVDQLRHAVRDSGHGRHIPVLPADP